LWCDVCSLLILGIKWWAYNHCVIQVHASNHDFESENLCRSAIYNIDNALCDSLKIQQHAQWGTCECQSLSLYIEKSLLECTCSIYAFANWTISDL
jgi:hypothetical protein